MASALQTDFALSGDTFVEDNQNSSQYTGLCRHTLLQKLIVKLKSDYFFTKKRNFLSKKKQVTTLQVFAQKIKNCPKSYRDAKACFTLGVRADVQPKPSIPIAVKVEISPKGFTL